MRLLLDTNALLWALAGAKRIAPVRELILADETEVFISSVSWWEIAIKAKLGKLDVDLLELRVASRDSGFRELSLTGTHAEILLTLPQHHRDPFDHMLIAQAIAEPMRFITGDAIMSQYIDNLIQI